LKKKGFKEERITTMGVDDIGTSHDPGIQQEPPLIHMSLCPDKPILEGFERVLPHAQYQRSQGAMMTETLYA
jgi:hypothetical protein